MLLSNIPNFLQELSSATAKDLALASSLLGVVSHIVYFRRHERDSQVLQFFFALVGIPPTILSLFYAVARLSLLESLKVTSLLIGPYFLGLYTSIVVYRLWFHPLSRFPGPFWLRITHLYAPWIQWRSGHQSHRLWKELHAKYGDIIRSGPNELSIIHPEIGAVLGKADKGPWYVLGLNGPSLQLVRDKKTHSIRRRVWDRAFTAEALAGYSAFVEVHSDQLLARILSTAKSQQPLNLTAWMNYYTFDVMGNLSFGKPFGMLETGGKEGSDYFMQLTHASMNLLGLLGKVPWLIYLLESIGMAEKKHLLFMQWCRDMVAKRKAMKTDRKDIYSYLLDAEPENKDPHWIDLAGDARLAIVAGSDTTASTMTTLFAYLATNQDKLRQLQQEVDKAYEEESCTGTKVPSRIVTGVPEIPFLDGCINEALRLHPAVPGGVQRIIPEEGVEIGGQQLPGKVNATLPLYAALRDKRYYADPDEFCPERWYESDPRTLTEMKAMFHPFWLGSFGCVGKDLALQQLRAVTSKIVRHFDFKLAEGFTVERALSTSIDTFTIEMGRVDMIFTQRKGVDVRLSSGDHAGASKGKEM